MLLEWRNELEAKRYTGENKQTLFGSWTIHLVTSKMTCSKNVRHLHGLGLSSGWWAWGRGWDQKPPFQTRMFDLIDKMREIQRWDSMVSLRDTVLFETLM